MGDVDEVHGAWANLNVTPPSRSRTPHSPSCDSAAGTRQHRREQLPEPGPVRQGVGARLNGATVGVQTDGGIDVHRGDDDGDRAAEERRLERPGVEENLARWQEEDAVLFRGIDATKHYHRLQIQDFPGHPRGTRAPRHGRGGAKDGRDLQRHLPFAAGRAAGEFPAPAGTRPRRLRRTEEPRQSASFQPRGRPEFPSFRRDEPNAAERSTAPS